LSYDRAARTVGLAGRSRDWGPVDSDEYLADLVLSADPDGLADLRARALEPLADLPDATRERLAETLLSWLLHQGRRQEVAAELHIHEQTVRYRMGQLRELYGDRLSDPRMVRDLVVALSAIRDEA
jgi:DNA-binding PucR family transcriptional regulator